MIMLLSLRAPKKDPSVFSGEEGSRTVRKIPLIFAVVLCGYEFWSVTLREEHRLKVFESSSAEEDVWATE